MSSSAAAACEGHRLWPGGLGTCHPCGRPGRHLGSKPVNGESSLISVFGHCEDKPLWLRNPALQPGSMANPGFPGSSGLTPHPHRIPSHGYCLFVHQKWVRPLARIPAGFSSLGYTKPGRFVARPDTSLLPFCLSCSFWVTWRLLLHNWGHTAGSWK